MKKHILIWLFGILSLIAYWIAGGLSKENIPYHYISPSAFWYIIWAILQLIMTYGVWLLIQEKRRSKWWLLLPLCSGLWSAIIFYFIPKKKEQVSDTLVNQG